MSRKNLSFAVRHKVDFFHSSAPFDCHRFSALRCSTPVFFLPLFRSIFNSTLRGLCFCFNTNSLQQRSLHTQILMSTYNDCRSFSQLFGLPFKSGSVNFSLAFSSNRCDGRKFDLYSLVLFCLMPRNTRKL